MRPRLRALSGSSVVIEVTEAVGIWQRIGESLPQPRRRSLSQRVAKRSLDFAVASILLVLLSPLCAAIALAIKLADSGPILFGHTRMALNGGTFTCWKFRSMRVGAYDELAMSGSLWTAYVDNDFKLPVASDERITRTGRWMRRYRLDELPQLWNVIRGDMSLVGPRPIEPGELSWYGPLRSELLAVRPGITGVWQLTSNVSHPERACLELFYVRTQSFAADLALLARTVTHIVSPERVSNDALPAETESLSGLEVGDG